MAHLYVVPTCAPCWEPQSRPSMAIYHLSASIIKRSAGRSVTAAVAYRAAAKIEDIRTGIIHDYDRKQGVDYSEIISPVSANSNSSNEWLTNRAELWNKVEQIEKRKDAQLAREVTIAIPTELSKPEQIALVREYVQTNYVAAGMIADISLHHLDGDNPHAHILLTMRSLQTSPAGLVEFGLKNTDWNSKELLLAQRKSWEEVANKYLAARGLDARIDCRSLEEQGSPYIPQIHVGVHAMAMKRKGIATDRSNEFDRIQSANNDIRAKLEEIYQKEYTEPEPESEVKPELTEQQQQQIEADRKLAELIIEVMLPTSKETQTFGVYTIKPCNNGYQVRTNNNHNVILNLKLENDIWVKSIRYHIKGNQRKHIYSNSDIDTKVEDFIKVIEDHQRKIDDLKIENEAEKEKIKTEIQIQKVNKEKAKAEAQIKKINNALLKPQKAEERRVKMEAQKIETKQRNLKKAEDHTASQIIANAERQVRLEAQKIETEKRRIETAKIRKEESQLAYEKGKVERERVATEINKAAENICHLLQNTMSVKFDIEGNILWVTRHSENHVIVNINKNWYDLILYSDNNWTIREDRYNTESFADQYKTIEKCLQIGTLISKTEEEPEEVIVDVVTPLIAEQIKIIIDELENPEEVTSDIDREISTPTSPPKIRSGDVVSRITLISQNLANQSEQKLEKPETIKFEPAIEEPEREFKPTSKDLKSVIAESELIIEKELKQLKKLPPNLQGIELTMWKIEQQNKEFAKEYLRKKAEEQKLNPKPQATKKPKRDLSL